MYIERSSASPAAAAGNGASTNLTDADADTLVHVEQTADEDRIRFETGSTFHASGSAKLGHADDAGFEFRKFVTDSQPLLSDDSIDPAGLIRRAETRLTRKALDNTSGLSTTGVVPGLGAADNGIVALHAVGRQSDILSVGTVIDSASNEMWGGVFSSLGSFDSFIGYYSGSNDAWFRTGGAYIRLSPTRFQFVEGATGGGVGGHIWARDDAHYAGGGNVHRPSFTAEHLIAQVGVTTYANQVFDATLRGMSWDVGSFTTTIGNSPTGAANTNTGFGMTTSAASTPSSATLNPGITLCSAFDFNGGSAPNTGVRRAEVQVEIAFEVVTPPAAAESAYEIQVWDNNLNKVHSQTRKIISFGPDITYQFVTFRFELQNPFNAAPGTGSLGYTQFEIRIQRIAGADDIQVIDNGSRISLRRME